MERTELKKLRFPIGGFKKPEIISQSIIKEWIKIISDFPQKVSDEIIDLSEEELNWIYRPDGWSIKQLVHHCADSHMNSFVRFKLALTEDVPTIKPYAEAAWAEMSDYDDVAIKYSLAILVNLHFRWTVLLKSLDNENLKREFYHPEMKKNIAVDLNIGLYAWHCEHHLEHIKLAKKFEGRFNVI